MKRILVTGATGNIGTEVLAHLTAINQSLEIIAAVRDVERAKKTFANYPKLQFRGFDFDDSKTFSTAFSEIDTLFLLRPPHISAVEKYFTPLLQAAKQSGIKQIVFLSVQGAEKSKVIPHNKIEALIRGFGFDYIFMRPSYFMQNLSTTLRAEIVNQKTITLPSGHAKFNWIDVKNIGEAAATLLFDFGTHKNKAFEITGTQNLSFAEVAEIMSEALETKITFKPINPIIFYLKKRKEGMQNGFAVVMTMLHFLPRIQEEPQISGVYTVLTGKAPTTVRQFVLREKNLLLSS